MAQCSRHDNPPAVRGDLADGRGRAARFATLTHQRGEVFDPLGHAVPSTAPGCRTYSVTDKPANPIVDSAAKEAFDLVEQHLMVLVDTDPVGDHAGPRRGPAIVRRDEPQPRAGRNDTGHAAGGYERWLEDVRRP